jgi:serine protease Do
MKKYALISAISFLVGLLLAGYVFVYLPDKNPPQTSALEAPSAGAFSSALFASPQAADKPDLDFATIAEKIGPSVVRISAERKEPMQSFGFDDSWPFGDDFFDRFFGRPSPRRNRPESQTVTVGGTGFFISSDGYILTNNHLVEKDKTTRVTVTTLQGTEYEAEIVGNDPGTDLALLKIKATDLPFAELGDSGKVKVGEWVLAIGNPLGMEHTVTAGIVSYKGRQIDTQSYQDFIQTDAAINRGNSGGPLVNTKGEVIGINSNILTQGTPGNIGIGLSIPSNIAKKVVVQLKEKGRVIRGYLGVYPGDISQGLAKTLNLESRDGIVVNDVEKDGPAEKAGLKQYDVITAINGEPIKNVSDLRFKIADIAPGTKVRLTVVRDGKEQTLTATLTELEAQEAADQTAEPETELGLSLTPLTPSIVRRYGLRTTEGLLITDVAPSSEAAREGLARGMIIIEVNRKKVTTVREFENIIAKTEKGDEVILLVRRETEERSQDFIVPVKVR